MGCSYSMIRRGCRKMPICRVILIPRHCGVCKRSKVEGLSASGGLNANEKKVSEVFCFCLEPRASDLELEISCASFLGISEALHLGIFHQPLKIRFFDSFARKFCEEEYCRDGGSASRPLVWQALRLKIPKTPFHPWDISKVQGRLRIHSDKAKVEDASNPDAAMG